MKLCKNGLHEFTPENRLQRKTGRSTCKPCALENSKRRKFKDRYNLSWDKYQDMFVKQNFRCATCGNKVPLMVDHNHVTNKVRKLLCKQCNSAIGYVNEDTKILMNMIRYLENEK